MPIPTYLIFALLSLVFSVISARDYLHGGRRLSPAGRVWLRIAVIFAIVAVLLAVML